MVSTPDYCPFCGARLPDDEPLVVEQVLLWVIASTLLVLAFVAVSYL